MKNFARLYTELDQTTSTLAKVDALVNYFVHAHEEDKLWAVALLSHRRPKRTVNATLLRQWAAERSNIPPWLFEESYHIVGDLAETISLVLPEAIQESDSSLASWINFIRDLEPLAADQKKERVLQSWDKLSGTERYIFTKLITGSFRVGVSQQLVAKALARYRSVAENIIAHRLMGNWSPDTSTLDSLLNESSGDRDNSKPYPFYLAYALEGDIGSLGNPDEWFAERKWDGIRGQVIVRQNELYVWTRGEELVTDKYPEFVVMKDILPEGTVLDGEILPFADGAPLPFQSLQTRIGRKKLSAKILKDVPVSFVAYDVLEYNGVDVRNFPLLQRREILEELCRKSTQVLRLSALVPFDSWKKLAAERAESRKFFSEGLMLKRKDSVYRDGRRKGDWWKWKIDPMSIDAVMIYAMRGHGRRANLYTDYTFAVWKDQELVPFAKAYSGLTDEEINAVDRWVKLNTKDKFGPVRSVKAELVFEIAFEGISRSTRHKSGIAVRFPRIHRWRKDKMPEEANTLDDLETMIRMQESQSA